MYYPISISAVRKAVQRFAPSVVSEECELRSGGEAPLKHLLWMCDKVERMDTTSIDDAVKAGRWMGWIFAHIELRCIWNNQETRSLVRQDKKNGHDKPHQK